MSSRALLVRTSGLLGQLLQGQHVRAGGGQVTGGADRVGVLGADVVADDGEVAAGVRLVAEQPAEQVQPHRYRQQQRGHRGGGAAPQRRGQQHRYEQGEPRQEGLHQAAEVPDPVRDRRVEQHEQAQQQCQRREDRAALPKLRPGADADRPADARASGTEGGIRAVGTALPGLRRAHLCRRLSSLTAAGHCCVLGAWAGWAYIRGQPRSIAWVRGS